MFIGVRLATFCARRFRPVASLQSLSANNYVTAESISEAVAARIAEQPHLLPKLALIGRPNVGKSALFNRLARRKAAVVYNTPKSHVTRDWHEETARLGDLVFRLADTAGVEPDAPALSIQ
ncbi:GTP-binding protein, partial [Haematococcus lacustris]